MLNKKPWLLIVSGACLCLAVCTEQSKERVPGEEVMHFPFAMAIKDQNLIVTSQASDGKHSYGRAVAVDTDAVDRALGLGTKVEPIAWKEIVNSNTLIPQDVGLIALGEHAVFASRQNNYLYAMPLMQKGFACGDASKKIEECPSAANLLLPENDPYSIERLVAGTTQDIYMASYLSSDRLDIIKLDKSAMSTKLSLAKYFTGHDFIKEKLGEGVLKHQRLTTRKITLSNQTAYFLFERHVSANDSLLSNTGAYLVSVKLSDLLSADRVPESAISVWDLKDLFGITMVQDVYVDGVNNISYILSRAPEALYKINLNNDKMLGSQTVCMGASSLAVSSAHDRVFIPCFSDNRVLSFAMSSLSLDATSGLFGRGPAFIAVDELHNKIFVSYNNDGKVVIFDFELNYLGYVFNQAQDNRIGS